MGLKRIFLFLILFLPFLWQFSLLGIFATDGLKEITLTSPIFPGDENLAVTIISTGGQIGGGESIEIPISSVAGAQTEKVCFWWLVFSLLALIFNLLYTRKNRKEFKKNAKKRLVLLLPAVAAYFLDKLMHRWWPPSHFCSYMWLFSLLTIFAPILVFKFFWRRKK